MTQDRDELLSAYLDGELAEAEMVRVEALLASDPAWQSALDAMLANDRDLAAALRRDIPDEVDDQTAQRFGLGDPAVPAAVNDNRPWARWLGVGGIAAAAAALLLLVRPTPEQPWQGEDFDRALSQTVTMQQASLDGGSTLTPLLSFRAADGRYCREFRLVAAKASDSRDGIACRDSQGWAPEVLVAGQPVLADPGRIEVAGGADRPELDRAYEKLGADAPLSIDDEKRLIASGW